jgi:hypothetical protein
MSKTLGTILTVVAIGVAIASGVGALAAGTAALISAGIAAAQFVNSAVLASRAKDALQKRQASVAALQLGEVAREGIFGEVLTGGSLVDAFNWGGQWGTDWECRVIALADHFCDALVGFYVNDQFVKYTGDGAVPGYNGQLEVYWRAGAVDQSVPQVVLDNGPGWTAEDYGTGVAWVAVCYKADKADAKTPVWPGGRPGFSWVVRGKRCYQARKDSTVGGSGTHRWSDPTTWEWTDNPIDCRHNWVRGIYAGDRVGDPDMLLVGRGLSAEEAPPANVFAPANVCDEHVALDAGGSEKRYRLNGLVRADETYIEVEDHFAAACAGVILQPEGAVEIEPGQAKAPSFFFSDEDLLVGSSVEYSDELSEADDGWVNTVAPRYVEPSLKYADHAAPIRRVVADVLADGGPREQPLSLTMVISSTQAGRVGEIARRLGRLRRRAKVTLGPTFAEVEEGDWGVWTSERYLKGKSVLFRVEAYALDEKWHNTLTLREISRDVYARDADAASTAVALQQDAPSIGAPGPNAWTAYSVSTSEDGRAMPVIAVTGGVDSDYADLVRFEYQELKADEAPKEARWVEAGIAGPDTTRFEISGVASETRYVVAVSYVVGRVPGTRRVIAPVTSGTPIVRWQDLTGAAKPADNADVTADAIDHSRFALCGPTDRIGTEIRSRFDPVFWTCNFPNTMIASLRASGDMLQADAVFHQKDHLLGIIWQSVDRWDHPTTGYDTDRDYRGCQLSFRLQLTGAVLPIDDVAGPVLTVEGRDAAGTARTWYVRLANLVTSGGGRDARIRIDFDRLRGGFYADDPVYAGDIDRIFLSLVPEGYSGGGGRLSGATEGGLILSEMTALGSRATLTCGTGPGGVHEVRMTNGYDDTYNVTPARIVRNLALLGYKDRLVHYVGMSHYFRWSWDGGEGRYIAEDVAEPLNRPCVLWHADFAARLRAAGIQLVLSLSYEMLDSFAPAAFRQCDASGAAALTGWSPPSTLFSPCHTGAMAYLQRVARQFCAIAAQAGHAVHFQVGEPWYWIDFRTRVPCFYDAATTSAYQAETGKTAPRIDTMAVTMTAEQIAYLDWLGGKLAASILGLLAAIRGDHPQAVRYALLYLPQMLDTATPEAMRVNLPKALQWPALDILQLEDYDYVIDNRPDLSATGRAVAEQRLGYPRSRQEYFGGFALHRDTGQIWRQTTNAIQAAYEHGVFPVYVWAYTQVMRDGYAPRLRMAPALGVADIQDIDLTAEPDDGAVLVFDTRRRKWVPGKPWLANT